MKATPSDWEIRMANLASEKNNAQARRQKAVELRDLSVDLPAGHIASALIDALDEEISSIDIAITLTRHFYQRCLREKQ